MEETSESQGKQIPTFHQRIYGILCRQEDGGIGFQNDVLYKPGELKGDFPLLQKLTVEHGVLMGSKTFLSLPEKFRPLPNRINIIITRHPEKFKDCDAYAFTDLVQAMKWFLRTFPYKHLACLGGAQIYELMLPYCDMIYETRVLGNRPSDVNVTVPESFNPGSPCKESQVFTGKNGEKFQFLELRNNSQLLLPD